MLIKNVISVINSVSSNTLDTLKFSVMKISKINGWTPYIGSDTTAILLVHTPRTEQLKDLIYMKIKTDAHITKIDE